MLTANGSESMGLGGESQGFGGNRKIHTYPSRASKT